MYILFELVIALIMISAPLYLLQLRYRWSSLTTRGPRIFLAIIIVVIWIVVAYGSFIEPRFLITREQTVTLAPGNRSMRLVLVSDFHLGRYRYADWVERVVERVNSLEPDVVVLLGDLVDGRRGTEELAPLGKLKTRYGAFAVLGNTDYAIGAVDVRHAIERYRVEVLTNEWVRLGADGPILAGLDDVWYGQPDWNRAFVGRPTGVPLVLAVHNPDEAARAEYHGVDLMLSGHTHGGQVRLPFFGSLAKLPITIDQHFDRGLFNWGAMQLYISAGVGESSARARLFSPPEVTQLNLSY
jgi:predicted MPP superfamily phosphohydrolase